jgi:hypothetical protein
MRLIEAYSCSVYGGKALRRQRQPLRKSLQALCSSSPVLRHHRRFPHARSNGDYHLSVRFAAMN